MKRIKSMLGGFAVLLSFAPTQIFAENFECDVYAVDNTSVSGSRRAQVWLSTDSLNPEEIMAMAYATAAELALDATDVFVTRQSDGETNEWGQKYSSFEALAQFRLITRGDLNYIGRIVIDPQPKSVVPDLMISDRKDFTASEAHEAFSKYFIGPERLPMNYCF